VFLRHLLTFAEDLFPFSRFHGGILASSNLGLESSSFSIIVGEFFHPKP